MNASFHGLTVAGAAQGLPGAGAFAPGKDGGIPHDEILKTGCHRLA